MIVTLNLTQIIIAGIGWILAGSMAYIYLGRKDRINGK